MSDKVTESGRVIRLSEAAKYLSLHFAIKQPVMLWGPPGIGKSELIAGIAEKYKSQGKTTKLVDVRLPLWEPTDIKGIPYYNQDLKTMTWAQPSELPSQEDAENFDVIILFLDELNGAAPAVQAAAYQLILNRRVGEYVLPDNVVIVAAGNRESDKGVSYRMPKPLANRMGHYELAVNFEDWAVWATDHRIHPDIVGYLTSRKQDLFRFDPKSNERSFATPRSWSFVSDMLYEAESTFSDQEITDMVSGFIGEGTALTFGTHRSVASKLPNPSHILDGTVKELKNTEISAKYSLATSISYELKSKSDMKGRVDGPTSEEFDDMMNNALRFMMNNFEPEMVIMSVRVLFTQYKVTPSNLRNMECWQDFLKDYGEYIKQA